MQATVSDFKEFAFGFNTSLSSGDIKSEYWDFLTRCERDGFLYVFSIQSEIQTRNGIEFCPSTAALNLVNLGKRFEGRRHDVYRIPDVVAINRIVVFKNLEEAMECLLAGEITPRKRLCEWIQAGRPRFKPL